MLRDAAVWLLHSPRRLLAVTVPLAAVAVLGTLGLNAADPTPRAAEPSSAEPPRTFTSRAASAAPEDHTETPAPDAVIRRAALRFLDGYVIPPGAAAPKAVPRSLRAASAPALWRGLRLTHPDTLPRGSVSRTSVDTAGSFAGIVIAELDTGPTLVVSVVAWERGWRVSDVRPAGAP